MNATSVTRDALKPRQPKGMGRGLGLALLVHAGLLVAIAFGVHWRSHEPEGVQAELWSAVPQTAAPRAAEPPPAPTPPPRPQPKPAPAPVVAPPPPKPAPDAQIAIEKEKQEKARQAEEDKARRLAEEKARKLAEERERQEQEAQKKKQLAEKQRKEELEAHKKEQADQARRDALRQQNLKRMMGQAGATGDERSTGTAQQSSGPSASYAGRIKARVKPNIVFPDDLPSNPTAEVEVRAGPDGTILGRTLTKSSGVKEWDEAVLRAIDRTEVLPRDVDGRVPPSLLISFRPRDL